MIKRKGKVQPVIAYVVRVTTAARADIWVVREEAGSAPLHGLTVADSGTKAAYAASTSRMHMLSTCLQMLAGTVTLINCGRLKYWNCRKGKIVDFCDESALAQVWSMWFDIEVFLAVPVAI